MDSSRTHTEKRAADRCARVMRRTLQDAGVSLAGRSVLALCSGGADSVALVELLTALPTGTRPSRIEVLHLDHGFRVPDPAEATAAADIAARHHLPFHSRRRMTEHGRPPAGHGDQGDGRAWRYEIALEVARDQGCDIVATGHHADDQVETALLAVFGNSGSGAQLAMPVVRATGSGDTQLVRPLLSLTHEQLCDYLRERDISWAEDPSNSNARFTRARLRAEAVPALQRAMPDAGAMVTRAARHLERDRDAARELAAAFLNILPGSVSTPAGTSSSVLSLDAVRSFGPAARSALVAEWLAQQGFGRAISERTVNAVTDLISADPGSRAHLTGGCVVRDRYVLRTQLTTEPQ